jgi:hypothetical protein
LLVRVRSFSSLKSWLAGQETWSQCAYVAVARKLAVIIHAMWRDGSEFRFKASPAPYGGAGQRARKLIADAEFDTSNAN